MNERKALFDYLESRYGIDKGIFEDFEIHVASKGRIFLGPKNQMMERVISTGILIARIGEERLVKPSSNLIQMFGKHASKNIVMLTKESAKKYAEGNDFEITNEETNGSEDGYVIISYKDYFLGCGLLKAGKIKNMLPKARRMVCSFL